ncbi:hypothetical protein EYC84_010454 [Monilinia fructicola]|uniref:Uncharacterized protein n=1 Tax=Monilinia fructicola TaxID=38448 RepID=A0A5M9JFL8_MONFR|nr:hypothetical protein EYC84_010454 [Monilinia fructicola]
MQKQKSAESSINHKITPIPCSYQSAAPYHKDVKVSESSTNPSSMSYVLTNKVDNDKPKRKRKRKRLCMYDDRKTSASGP